MVLIKDVTLTGKRPSLMNSCIEGHKKLKEVYLAGVGMVPVEEPTTVEVNITIVLTEKEDAVLKNMFDSK